MPDISPWQLGHSSVPLSSVVESMWLRETGLLGKDSEGRLGRLERTEAVSSVVGALGRFRTSWQMEIWREAASGANLRPQ